MDIKIKQNFSEFFRTDKKGIVPYPYQEKVIKTLLVDKKNVLLHIPTGGGKTLAAVAPYLMSEQLNYDFPGKMIYSFPLRTLVNAVHQKLTEQIKNEDLKMSLQTGTSPDDPKFLSDLILTTYDQTLSAYLKLPIPVSYRLSNINTGALLGAYLVFDEFHLFDPERSFLTTLKVLEQIKHISPFMIMTATLPQNMIDWLSEQDLNLEVISLTKEEIAKIENLNGEKKLDIVDQELTVKDILQYSKGKTLVIVNRVKKAQKLYQDLKAELNNDEVDLQLLHARFLSEDRSRNEEKLLNLFQKDNNKKVICIATQVVEVGLDISADVLLSENAPMDSLIQRIGRVARYANEKGTIYVFKTPTALPYKEKLLEKSWEALEQYKGTILTHGSIKSLIEAGLSEYYENLISKMKNNISDRDRQIKKALSLAETNKKINWYDTLVREIDSVYFTIHSDPENVDIYSLERFQVPRSFLRSTFRKIENPDEWILKAPIRTDEEDEFGYKLKTLSGSKSELETYVTFVGNPKYFYYDDELGLVADYKEGEDLIKSFSNKRKSKYSYPDLLWKDHIRRTLLTLTSSLDHEYQKTNYILSEQFPLVSDEIIKQIVPLTLILHDLGKLNTRWQEKARGDHLPKDQYYSHTSRSTKLPKHSAISGFLSFHIVRTILEIIQIKNLITKSSNDIDSLANIITTAIMTHHGPEFPKNLEKFRIDKGAQALIKAVLAEHLNYTREIVIRPYSPISQRCKMNPQKKLEEYLCYLQLVRVLRLADQLSFENIEGSSNYEF